jgi:EAL domain-containing protein (putative c-di-GMP-specific phosphodiesterase class I)
MMTMEIDSTIDSTLFPYFQPIIGTASGAIEGYETLARQRDQKGQVISAGALFSRLDLSASHLIALDRSVRSQALKQFKLLSTGYLTLNISAAWIDDVVDFNSLATIEMLERLGIDKSRIVIEITESQGNLEKLFKAVEIYRRHGLRIAIDDFGAGFSQLERVMAIQPDIIKLDMQLFQNAARGGVASDVVHLLSRLAKRSGCRIVCEGVETNDDFLFGLSCGAQFMQGYLFSSAMATFQAPMTFYSQICQLRNEFLERALYKEKQKQVLENKIRTLIFYLKSHVKTENFLIHQLALLPFKGSGVLHFYICDNQGNQISPNYNVTEEGWAVDASKLDLNWAWRPHFYEALVRDLECNECCRIVISDRYRDFSTGTLCQTFALRLDENRVLLVDVIADWL